jgi:hypothetical protein
MKMKKYKWILIKWYNVRIKIILHFNILKIYYLSIKIRKNKVIKDNYKINNNQM